MHSSIYARFVGMKVRVLYVIAVSSAVFCSWLITYSFDCYYHGSVIHPSKHPKDDQPPFPDGSLNNIVWFLQISDLHVSIVNKFAVVEDLTYFCSETVGIVDPAVVLVTGKLRFHTSAVSIPDSLHPYFISLYFIKCRR